MIGENIFTVNQPTKIINVKTQRGHFNAFFNAVSKKTLLSINSDKSLNIFSSVVSFHDNFNIDK
jgi:hypothetical protein